MRLCWVHCERLCEPLILEIDLSPSASQLQRSKIRTSDPGRPHYKPRSLACSQMKAMMRMPRGQGWCTWSRLPGVQYVGACHTQVVSAD